jgi:hypothetical protein
LRGDCNAIPEVWIEIQLDLEENAPPLRMLRQITHSGWCNSFLAVGAPQ